MTNYVSKCMQIDDWWKVETLKGDLHSFEDSGIPLMPNTLQVIVVFSILYACLVALILPKERTAVHFWIPFDIYIYCACRSSIQLRMIIYVCSQSFTCMSLGDWNSSGFEALCWETNQVFAKVSAELDFRKSLQSRPSTSALPTLPRNSAFRRCMAQFEYTISCVGQRAVLAF